MATSISIASKDDNNDNNTGYQLEKNLKELNNRYQDFLNMVSYIATDQEIKIFKKLPTVRDRDVFINFFWKHRDPTQSTPENEYKLEIAKRFAYVNRMFGRGTPLPGWKTARGKIYMILGKPSTIENFDNEQGLYPARVWAYYGDKDLGLPTYFNIVFFKRRGTGDWDLYNHTADGPASLLVQGDTISMKDYRALYQDIKKLAPTLATPAITMVPNEIPYNYRPSPLNNMIMANVYKSPSKKLNVSYANHFMDYKGYVNVEASVNYIESAGSVAVLRHGRFKNAFIHFSIKPKKIALDFIEPKNKYYYNFQMVASLMQGDRLIYEYSKNFYQYIDAANLDILKAGGVVLHDFFPVIPGDYKVRLFIRNKVGNEFSYYEKNVDVPTATAVPYLATPVAAYGKQAESDAFFCPYKINGERLFVDPDKSFAIDSSPHFLIGIYNLNRETWDKGSVQWELSGQKESAPYMKKGTILLKDKPLADHMNFIVGVPENELKTNYYDFVIHLKNHAGIITDTKKVSFSVSPFKNVSFPTENYNRIQVSNPFYFRYILGLQYHNTGRREEADTCFQQMITANPAFSEGLLALLGNQLELKKYAAVLERVDQLKGFEKLAFPYRMIKGQAYFGLEKYEEALAEFLEANKLFNSNIRLINLMGMTFLKLKNYDEALKAFEASLKLNRKQPVVQKTIDRIKKEKAQ